MYSFYLCTMCALLNLLRFSPTLRYIFSSMHFAACSRITVAMCPFLACRLVFRAHRIIVLRPHTSYMVGCSWCALLTHHSLTTPALRMWRFRVTPNLRRVTPNLRRVTVNLRRVTVNLRRVTLNRDTLSRDTLSRMSHRPRLNQVPVSVVSCVRVRVTVIVGVTVIVRVRVQLYYMLGLGLGLGFQSQLYYLLRLSDRNPNSLISSRHAKIIPLTVLCVPPFLVVTSSAFNF